MRKNPNLLPTVMMVILFGMIALVTNLAAPVGIIVKEQFQTGSFLGMLGNFANFIAYAVMGLPSGHLLTKLGYRRTAILAIVIGFSGVLIQYISGLCSSFPVYLTGAFVSGFSMCMLNTVINPMLNILGGCGRNGNRLIQVGGTVSSMVAMVVPILVGIMIGEVSSKTSIADVNILLFIAMGIFLVIGAGLCLIRLPEPYRSELCELPVSGSLWKYPHFVLGVIAIFVGVGIEVGIPGTLNFYLVDSGLSVVSSGMVVGVYYILMLCGRLMGAVIGGRMHSKDMLKLASGIGLLLLLCGMYLPETFQISLPVFKTVDGSFALCFEAIPLNALFLVLCGLCSSVLWGVIFNLAVEGLGPLVPRASGIFMTMVCGGGILPLIQNSIADGIGYLPSFWVPTVCFVYLLYYSIVGYRQKTTDNV